MCQAMVGVQKKNLASLSRTPQFYNSKSISNVLGNGWRIEAKFSHSLQKPFHQKPSQTSVKTLAFLHCRRLLAKAGSRWQLLLLTFLSSSRPSFSLYSPSHTKFLSPRHPSSPSISLCHLPQTSLLSPPPCLPPNLQIQTLPSQDFLVYAACALGVRVGLRIQVGLVVLLLGLGMQIWRRLCLGFLSVVASRTSAVCGSLLLLCWICGCGGQTLLVPWHRYGPCLRVLSFHQMMSILWFPSQISLFQPGLI